MRGGVKWQIQHEAKPKAVFATSLSAIFYRITRVYSAFTELLVLGGRINSVIPPLRALDMMLWIVV